LTFIKLESIKVETMRICNYFILV